MHLLTDASGKVHDRYITGNDSRNARFFGRPHNGAHLLHIIIINNHVHRQVTLHAMIVAHTGYFTQIINRKSAGRARTHIQVLYTEVNRICSCLNGSGKRLP